MTQPYTPPPDPAYPQYPVAQADPRAAFRRAAMLMFVLAAMMLLFSGCTWMAARMPVDQWPPAQRSELQRMDTQLRSESGKGLAETLAAVAIVVAVPSVLMIGLGFGVRSGSRGWIVAAMVMAALVLLPLIAPILATLLGRGNVQDALAGAVLLAVPTGLFVLLLVWLKNAYRAAGQSAAIIPPYPIYAQPYPQQMQPPQQGYGYGYGYPPQQPGQGPPTESGTGPNPPASNG
jgi:hypothetical protein